jgi:hypothetical protein
VLQTETTLPGSPGSTGQFIDPQHASWHDWPSRLRNIRRAAVVEHLDAHFQCGLQPMWPAKVQHFKFPLSGDCRDIISLNAALALLGRVCDES